MVYYNSINDIKEVFFEYFQDGHPAKWALYSGKGRANRPTGKTAMGNLLYAQNADMEPGESWRILEGKLSKFGQGGYAHLYLGDENEYTNIPIYFNHTGSAGINGQPDVASFSGLPYNLLTAIEKERQLWDLENKLERILESQAANVSVWDRVGEKLLESDQLPAMINGLSSILMRFLSPQTVPLQVKQAPVNQAERMADQPRIDSGAAIGTFVQRLRNQFSDENEFSEYLEKVADLIEVDPAGMKQLVNQVHQQLPK